MKETVSASEQTAPDPKRHHWVPRFYLRHFAIPETMNRKYPLIWQVEVSGGAPVGRPSPPSLRTAASEMYLYAPMRDDGTRDFALEHKFSEVEGELHRLWARLSEHRPAIDDNIKQALSVFLGVQLMRHPRARDLTQRLATNLKRHVLQHRAGAATPSDLTMVVGEDRHVIAAAEQGSLLHRRAQDVDAQWVRTIPEHVSNIARQLMSHSFSIVCADEPVFLTSDSPVMRFNRRAGGTQLNDPHTFIIMPMTPSRALFVEPPGGREVYGAATPVAPAAINAMTVGHALRFVFAPSDPRPLIEQALRDVPDQWRRFMRRPLPTQDELPSAVAAESGDGTCC